MGGFAGAVRLGAAAVALTGAIVVSGGPVASEPEGCEYAATMTMKPVVHRYVELDYSRYALPEDERPPVPPTREDGPVHSYEMCADGAEIVFDERDRGKRGAGRWAGIVGGEIGVVSTHGQVVPFRFGDTTLRNVSMAFGPGLVAFASSDGEAFRVRIDDVQVRLLDGGAARAEISGTGFRVATRFAEGSQGSEVRERNEVEVDLVIDTESHRYDYGDIPGVTTNCVGQGFSAVARGSVAFCVAVQPNGGGMALVQQTFLGAGAVSLSVDLGLHTSVSDAGFISETLGLATCGAIGGGAGVTVGVGIGVEVGTCTSDSDTSVYFSRSVSAGLGANWASVGRVHTVQVSPCFHPDGLRLFWRLFTKRAKCEPSWTTAPDRPPAPVTPVGIHELDELVVPTSICEGYADGHGPIRLSGGEWTGDEVQPGGSVGPQVRLVGGGIDDLDGDGAFDGVAHVSCDPGGSSVFDTVLVLFANDRIVRQVRIGERVHSDWELWVRDVEVDRGRLTVRYSAAPFGEPHCCRGRDVVEVLELPGGGSPADASTWLERLLRRALTSFGHSGMRTTELSWVDPATETERLLVAVASDDAALLGQLGSPFLVEDLRTVHREQGFAGPPRCQYSSVGAGWDCLVSTGWGWTVALVWIRESFEVFRVESHDLIGGGA